MKIKPIDRFLREVKQLSKKYKKIFVDLENLEKSLFENPKYGKNLGKGLYKIRLENSSIPTGKRGGFRVISYFLVENTIYLLSIYSKTDKDNISDKELKEAFKELLEIKKKN